MILDVDRVAFCLVSFAALLRSGEQISKIIRKEAEVASSGLDSRIPTYMDYIINLDTIIYL